MANNKILFFIFLGIAGIGIILFSLIDRENVNLFIQERILKIKDNFLIDENFIFEKNLEYFSQFHFNEEERPILNLETFPLNGVQPQKSNWTVSWSAAPTYISGNSWIGVYPFAQKTNNWNLQNYFNIDKIQNGMKELAAPKEAGIYEIRYIQDNNLHTIASTGPLIVNPNDVELILSKTETHQGDSIFAKFSIEGESHIKFTNGRNGANVIEIFFCLNVIGSYDYEDCYWKKKIENSSGVEKIKVPTIAGYFVLRILIKYHTWKFLPEMECIGVSTLLKVTNPEFILKSKLNSVVASHSEIKWKVPKAKENDWIGFFSLDNNEIFTRSVNPIDSVKVKKLKKGKFSAYIPTNQPAGPYMFIYFRNHKPIAISDIINVQQPQVKCPEINETNNNNLTMSKIKHLVIICTENHSFDSYFGNYCEGEENINNNTNVENCNNGAKCCNKPPQSLGKYLPVILNDTQNLFWDPNHNQDCERCEINGGRMDGYIENCFCSDPQNFAVADKETMKILHEYARTYSLADNYFQPSAGASAQNDMYFARADYVFRDNVKIPIGSVGSNCWYLVHGIPDEVSALYDPTITSLLSKCGFILRTYAEGYNNATSSFENNKCYPEGFDASDIPFNYYVGATDNPKYIRDYENFIIDIQNKTLPDVSFIKPLGIRTAHPGDGTITDEINFIKQTVDFVLNSEYSEDTLILWVPDESGGYFDHISPPKTNPVDKMPYGPRIPLLALGKFAKKNYISHVLMEHSSIVKFIEWNWLNGKSGQLNTRDRNVNSIGDLIDASAAGIKVPN